MRFFSALFVLLAVTARAEELTVVTWGGAYEAAQAKAVFAPFTKATGIKITTARYDGSLTALTARADAEGWDVIDMLEPTAITACDAGLLARLDHAALTKAPSDFAPAKLRPCSLPQNVFATVMAYAPNAFPGVKPTTIADFFDTARFPGKRAIRKSPDDILEWALLAEGVPPSQVYDLLSTDRGLRLAFRKLDQIRDHIVWWEDAADPPRLLAKGRASMASGYNGRFFAAQQAGDPLSVVWHGRIIGHEVWGIAKGTDAPDAARRFLRFATRPDTMARLSERIPYGPARQSALPRIGLQPGTGIPMRDHLPNAPQHGPTYLVRDSLWHSHTADLRKRRFDAWLARGEDDG
ncbi:ABC transporter substrate-binding protein [Roseovarius sp. MMSF_3281]|uniref:ABC transporter substrate-binding protein n=1 Tax=Roseovarius sp. MMSF_3281 TaxID=3046694 RepID=UPI00273DA246|nr:ABC transporter substrate-binding protein [Roseovarius sp. MMSF_3281]